MKTTHQSVSESFWRDGYAIVRDAFSFEEVESYRSAIEECARHHLVVRAYDSALAGEVSTLPDPLGKLPTDERILTAARDILGGTPIYFGDSSVAVGTGGRGWHKDNRPADRCNPSGTDWEGKYGVLRVGIYLQDHSRHSDGLGLRVGSHRLTTNWKVRIAKRFLRRPINGMYSMGRPIHVNSRSGDLVFWNLRTTHSGNSTRVRGIRGVKLHPRIEPHVPSWLRVPQERQRMAIFLTYGIASQHLDNYRQYFESRE